MRKVLLHFVLLVLVSAVLFGKDEGTILRWTEGLPGCTFSAGDDGLYRYGLWTDDFGIILAVDADELRKARSRTEPTFAVLLTVRYRGNQSLTVNPDAVTLEYVKHDHDKHAALTPADLSARLQKDVDSFSAQLESEIKKHPERKTQEEAILQDRQKSIASMIEFLRTQSLNATQLNPTHSEVSGWVFFAASGKWIGEWKRQEELVLTIRLANRTIEFPFALPPSQGDVLLRKRPND
jgi:hypothetical protein